MKLRYCLVLFALLLCASSAKAQVAITVTPANTHQTWRFYGGNAPNHSFDDTNCTFISNAMFAQALPYLFDAGVTDGRIDMGMKGIWETRNGTTWANDNTDPFNIDLTGFNFGVTYLRSGTCPTTQLESFAALQSEKTAALSAGISLLTTLRLNVIPTSVAGNPAGWLWNGAGSAGFGKDEMSEAYQAITDYVQANYGFCFDHVEFNEPDGEGGYPTATNVGASSWLPGVTTSFTSRITSDTHCQQTRFIGPADANGNNVVSDLSTYYGPVTGSESNLKYITYHSYPFPADNGASIYARAHAEGKETAENEVCYNGGCAYNLPPTYANALTILTGSFLPLVNVGNISGWDWLGIWGICYSNPGCNVNTSFAADGIGIGWDLATTPNGNSPQFYLQPLYYVFRQFAKYVKTGSIRVDASTSNPSLPVSAWKRSDGSLVVFIVNNTGSTQSVTLNGLPNSSFSFHKLDPSMCVTTGQFRCTPDDSATATPSGGSLTISLVNQAVWTLEQLPTTLTQFDKYGGIIRNAAGQVVSPCAGGVQAKFYKEKDSQSTPHWWFCTPLGNRMYEVGSWNIQTQDFTDSRSNNNKTIVTNKYNTNGGTYPASWYQSVGRHLQKFYFNAIDETMGSTNPNLLATAAPSVLLPFQGGAWHSYRSVRNQNNYTSQATMAFGVGVKFSIPALNGGNQESPTGSCNKQVDVFDPNYTTWSNAWMANEPTTKTWYQNTNNDFMTGWVTDDEDQVSFIKAGPNFGAIVLGMVQLTDNAHTYGCMDESDFALIASPLKSADSAGSSGVWGNGIMAEQGIVDQFYPSNAFNSKQEMVNWLQGTTEAQTPSSVSGNGTTVTATFASNFYLIKDVLTVTGCSIGAFNTAAGTPVTVLISSPTQVTYSQAATGTPTGCSFHTGPGYTIGPLNTAWGASYVQFASRGAAHTDTLGTGNGVTTSFSITLANTPDPCSVQVLNAGVVVSGDDCSGPSSTTFANTGNFRGANVTATSSTINYATKAVTVVFAVAPLNGNSLTISYVTGGWPDNTVWGEDGTHSWIPTNFFLDTGAGSTATYRTDMQNFLFHFGKKYFNVNKASITAVDPGRLYLGPSGIGGWASPPRAPVIWACSQICDVIPINSIPSGVNTGDSNCANTSGNDQCRVNFIGQNMVVDKPWIEWVGGLMSANGGTPGTSGNDSYEGASGSSLPRNLAQTILPLQNTQGARATLYNSIVNSYLTMTDSTWNTVHILGHRWWQYYDDSNEGGWGFMSFLDTAYDGYEACNSTGRVDQWGYVVGTNVELGSGNCYGNGLGGNGQFGLGTSGIGITNQLWWQFTLTPISGNPPAPPNSLLVRIQ